MAGRDLCLVTNWHVLARKNPETGVSGHETSFRPNRITFHISVALPRDKQGLAIDFRPMDLPLVDADGQVLWWQHPGYRGADGLAHHVDIGVLPLTNLVHDIEKVRTQVQSFDQQVLVYGEIPDEMTIEQGHVRIGSEVFILGYPLGLASQGVAPIWKRGSVASEPLFGLEGNLPVILVDAATRSGMSGAPVIYLGDELTNWNGVSWAPRDTSDPWLVGVHAGRRGSTEGENSMALGRTWKLEMLHEIVMYHVPGCSPPQLRTE